MLYYLFENEIRAIPKIGGTSVAIATNVRPVLIASHTIDDFHIYWVDYADQSAIRRKAKNGSGGVETFWSAGRAGRGIADLVIDACNVYWTAGFPDELLVRAKHD